MIQQYNRRQLSEIIGNLEQVPRLGWLLNVETFLFIGGDVIEARASSIFGSGGMQLTALHQTPRLDLRGRFSAREGEASGGS